MTRLLDPLERPGFITLRNRTVMSAMSRSFAGEGRHATDAMRDYYKRRADGGVGLILTEGTIIQRVGGQWYLFASDGDAREYRVYDLDVNHLGSLDAPYRTNIPHPQLVEVPLPGGPPTKQTQWWLVTFDGTQYAEGVLGYGGPGDVLVMREQPG